MKITFLKAREILDSRGFPTVEVELELTYSVIGRAMVPSGASTGSKEALELRDGDIRYMGKGVLKAVKHVNHNIRNSILNNSYLNQEEFDQALIELDGTENKSNLGANAILACSLAFARAKAGLNNTPLFKSIKPQGEKSLPTPFINIINGGAHADNNLAIQEFMIVPIANCTFNDKLRMGSEVFHSLKKLLHNKGFSTGIGDEGGFAPNFKSTTEALDMIIEAIKLAGYQPGIDIAVAIDAAASEFFHENLYHIDGKQLSSDEIIKFYTRLSDKYPIISLEDPLSEFDTLRAWQDITLTLGQKLQIVGDDIFVTNPKILTQGIEDHVANAILIKLNQIGTLTETLATIDLAYKNNYKVIISHRSGETEDAFIAHLAVAVNSGQIKTGSLCRGERIAKYNELIRIAEILGN